MMHVPERWRLRRGRFATTERDGNNGAFVFKSVEPGWTLFVLASDGLGWEHVSAHAFKFGKTVIDADTHDPMKLRHLRTPTWREMCQVKGMFWDAEDPVMQLHPRRSQYVNEHPNVLHLWRPTGDVAIPEPPAALVGPLPSTPTPQDAT